MRKKVVAVLAAGAALTMVVGAMGLAACDNSKYYTVTYMDGREVLKTEKVKEGEKAPEYKPTKDGGYEFVDWFATPSKNHRFDLTAPITEDVTVYAGYTLFKNDTRDFYVLGSGTSELLFTSNWGKVITDDHKLTKDATKNEYTITMDLKQGDKFQFAINDKWENKRGYGYLATLVMADGKEAFSGEGSVYDDSSKGSNIVCEYSGNYTFTLKTYPNEDYYNTSAPTYTEAEKEVYNLGTYDTIEWVRNGDVINDSLVLTDFYIKGASITNWKDMFNTSTQMVRTGTKYTMSVYLKANDQFMFTSRVTKIENGESTVSSGTDYINFTNITDDTSKTYVEKADGQSTNIVAKAAGTYTLTYDSTAKTLAVTFDATKLPEACDYYINGSFGQGWDDYKTNSALKFTETAAGSGVYKVENISLAAGNEFAIRSFAAGTTDFGGNFTDYQFAYLYMADTDELKNAFDIMGGGNNNIKVVTAGTYDIQIDSYSKIITITKHA